MIKYKGKQITIDDFTPVVPFDYIKSQMGKRNYDKFMKWMFGQTVSTGGVYYHDLKRWLEMENNGRPTYFD